jgi:hypothetical protein
MEHDMNVRNEQIGLAGIATALLAAAVITGCGGSAYSSPGGGYGGGGGGATPSPTPSATPSMTPTPMPQLTGDLNVAISGSYPSEVEGAAANASVDITCGCSPIAGNTMADPSGNFTALTMMTPVPTPNPTYTLVPGRNYMVIGDSMLGTAGKAQAWNIMFAGNTTAHNHYLTDPNPNLSDTYTAAVALYVFFNSPAGQLAFDDWNFFTLQGYYTHLKTMPSAAEIKLLSDIVSQQEAGNRMYPVIPGWRPGRIPNPVIKADLGAITGGPTPCPVPSGGPAMCTSPFPTP